MTTETDLAPAPALSGRTTVLTIIGHPIAQVRSPTTLNPEFRRSGVDAVLVPVDLEPAALPDFIRTLRGWRNAPGTIVTVPHKMPCASLVDDLTDRARLLGAVNLIRRRPDGRLAGDMSDGPGFLKALAAGGFDPAGKNAVVFGAGAVGRALLLSLTEAGVSRIAFHEPDDARREALAALAKAAGVADRLGTDVGADLGAYHLAINASPVGMGEDGRMPFDPTSLPRDALVADVVTEPVETPLLKAARAHGCRVQTGLAMSDAQVAMQIAFFDLGRAG
ncbi:shikimate dehydrogenase family protein [Phreatobacter stygius]|uniref:Shikimate dehydrogenase n=1 Tax=Phreatobacter stygius TaxID=1940610 RepID=A0A4D7B2S5_9HYPH|nr:shikimate dehydrogenase [Phreatobacter stygius]QCI65353.1 shikimate dehydrogenase [Phreatobacter stygius]